MAFSYCFCALGIFVSHVLGFYKILNIVGVSNSVKIAAQPVHFVCLFEWEWSTCH